MCVRVGSPDGMVECCSGDGGGGWLANFQQALLIQLVGHVCCESVRRHVHAHTHAHTEHTHTHMRAVEIRKSRGITCFTETCLALGVSHWMPLTQNMRAEQQQQQQQKHIPMFPSIYFIWIYIYFIIFIYSSCIVCVCAFMCVSVGFSCRCLWFFCCYHNFTW